MNAALIAVPAAALIYLLAGGKKAAPKSSTPTALKSPAQRMAEALATNNPATIRTLAGALRIEGYAVQASDLESAASKLEAARPVAVPAKPPAAVKPPAASSPAVKPPAPAVQAPPTVVVTAPPPPSAPAGKPPTITAALRSLPAILGTKTVGGKLVFEAPRSKGPAVKDWQSVLRELGFTQADPDGKFGNATEVATRAFQTAANESASRAGKPLLDVDGMVGPKTVARAAEARVVSGGPSSFSGDESMFGYDVPVYAPSSPQPDSPLPGAIPVMAPVAPNPRRALAARLYNSLCLAPAGGEDRTLVALYQAQEGLKPTGYYNPSTALSLARSYGIVPPKPLYWTDSRTSKSKATYRDALRALGAADPQRAEEWQRASNV